MLHELCRSSAQDDGKNHCLKKHAIKNSMASLPQATQDVEVLVHDFDLHGASSTMRFLPSYANRCTST